MELKARLGSEATGTADLFGLSQVFLRRADLTELLGPLRPSAATRAWATDMPNFRTSL